MENVFNIRHRVTIVPDKATVDGKVLETGAQGEALLSALYRQHVGDYPKFFKMDLLCKLGFVASELLLRAEQAERFVPREDRAVILFNRTSSYHADAAYQETIQHAEDFFPSPALFVYTLPNIVTGEIAIRNKYYGESNFYVLPTRDLTVMREAIGRTFQDRMTASILAGWVEAPDAASFEAELWLIED